MQHLCIDESGSMLSGGTGYNAWFVIAVLHVKEPKRLRQVYKRFVGKQLENLRACDKEGRMFDKDGKFKELKGSAMSRPMKLLFLDYFCQNDLFDVFPIIVDNAAVTPKFYASTARAFNYLLHRALLHYFRSGALVPDHHLMQVDERNVKTNTKAMLEEYLNTEFTLGYHSEISFDVAYFDSAQNTLIQIADVFANIIYSNCFTGAYNTHLQKLKTSGYIHEAFVFPLNGNKAEKIKKFRQAY